MPKNKRESFLNRILFRGIFSVIIVMFTLCSAFANSTQAVKQNIVNQAKSMGVEPAIVLSIAKAESGFNQNARGAGGRHIGVFQLSQTTAKNMGLNPYNLDDNIKGGITYYKRLYKILGSTELAVAAYNIGPDAIKRNNNTIPKYTQNFVNRIMADYRYYKKMGF